MLGFRRLGLIQVDYLEKGKLIHNILDSVRTTEKTAEEGINNIIKTIILFAILTSLFFARNLVSLLVLIFIGLVFSILFKDYIVKDYIIKERRSKQ
jgi:hypothetical protein